LNFTKEYSTNSLEKNSTTPICVEKYLAMFNTPSYKLDQNIRDIMTGVVALIVLT